MSVRVFYVGANLQNDEKTITGYVPAKFLTLNGEPVVDPVPGGSQKTNIYADGSDKYKTSGAIANPNNYLIVPANYTEQQARAFAAHIAGTMDLADWTSAGAKPNERCLLVERFTRFAAAPAVGDTRKFLCSGIY